MMTADRQPIPPCMTCRHLEDWPDRYDCKPWKDKIPGEIMDGRKDCHLYEPGRPQRKDGQEACREKAKAEKAAIQRLR